MHDLDAVEAVRWVVWASSRMGHGLLFPDNVPPWPVGLGLSLV